MSTTPWGTMNGWLRIEGEQRGAWLDRRVQDVRAAQIVRRTEPVKAAAPRVAERELAPAIPLQRSAPSAAAQSSRSQQPCTEVA